MSDQPSLFGWVQKQNRAVARKKDPVSSHEAAEKATSKVTERRAAILKALKRAGKDGSTVSDLSDKLQLPRDTVSPRMADLEKAGLVVRTGERRLPLNPDLHVRQVVFATTEKAR